MSDHRKPENHRRLVDMIADAMSHAIKNGREEFAEHLGSIRDLDVDTRVEAGYDRRPYRRIVPQALDLEATLTAALAPGDRDALAATLAKLEACTAGLVRA